MGRPPLHNRVTTALAWGAFLASVSLAFILLWHASHLRGADGLADDSVRLGPLSLMRITKEGANVSFAMLPGLAAYYAAWLAACALSVVRRVR